MPMKEQTLHEPTDLLMDALRLADEALAVGARAKDAVLRAQRAMHERELRFKELADNILYGQPTRDLARQLARIEADDTVMR